MAWFEDVLTNINNTFLAIGTNIKELFSRSMPPGGTAGQTIVKQSSDDYDYRWGSVQVGNNYTPTLVTEPVFTVPLNTQLLFVLPIELAEGSSLDVEGSLVEIS